MRRGYRTVVVVGSVAVGLLALALVMGGGLLARPAEADPEAQGRGHGQVVEIFLSKLAGILNRDREQLDADIKLAAQQTVDELAAQGELTTQQAERVKECIQERDAQRFHFCLVHHHGEAFGPGPMMGPMMGPDGMQGPMREPGGSGNR